MTQRASTEPEGPTFPAPPPERIVLRGELALVRLRVQLVPAIVDSINQSLEHLKPWMAWAQEPATEASIGTFAATSEELWERRREFGYSILHEGTGQVVGGAGLHGRLGPHGLEIGYWVHVDWIGRGIATDASSALTDAAFGIAGIERVRIQCEDGNARSARVPEKLGFRFDGVVAPEGGPSAGRRTQVWHVERADWVRHRREGSP